MPDTLLIAIGIFALLCLAGVAVYLPMKAHDHRLAAMREIAEAKARAASQPAVDRMVERLVPAPPEVLQSGSYWRGLTEGVRFCHAGHADRAVIETVDEMQRQRVNGEPEEQAFAIGWIRAVATERQRLRIDELLPAASDF